MANVKKVTPALKAKFLEHYREFRGISRAAMACDVHPKTIYEYLKPESDYFDPKFAEDVEIVKTEIKEEVLITAFERALDGWEEPVFYQGEKLEEGVKKKSDYILGILLKGFHRDDLAERNEFTGVNGGPLRFSTVAEKSLNNKLDGIAKRLGVEVEKDDDKEGVIPPPVVKKKTVRKKVAKKKTVRKKAAKKKVVRKAKR